MNLGPCEIHSMIFELFVRKNPTAVYSMKSCEHGLNLNDPNPHHMEGDVWTHTCIAYQSLLHMDDYYSLSDDQKIFVCLTVLCHDLGKPFKRVTNDNNRHRFAGHEKRSVAEMINLIPFFRNDCGLKNDRIYEMMCVVSAHSEYWLGQSMQNVFDLLNYDEELLDLYKIVVSADKCGQITMRGFESKADIDNFNFNLYGPDKFQGIRGINIYMLIGPPASGKDYLIDNSMSGEVAKVSYDSIRVRLYLKDNPAMINNANKDEVYSMAWAWCNINKINLDIHMMNDIDDALKTGVSNIAISNTNMTTKGRVALIKKLRDNFCIPINVIASVVMCGIDELVERDNNRQSDDKSVGKDVITRMFYNFEIPTLAEGFDGIIIADNDRFVAAT